MGISQTHLNEDVFHERLKLKTTMALNIHILTYLNTSIKVTKNIFLCKKKNFIGAIFRLQYTVNVFFFLFEFMWMCVHVCHRINLRVYELRVNNKHLTKQMQKVELQKSKDE